MLGVELAWDSLSLSLPSLRPSPVHVGMFSLSLSLNRWIETDLINLLNLQKPPTLLVCYCRPVTFPLAEEEISPSQKELGSSQNNLRVHSEEYIFV